MRTCIIVWIAGIVLATAPPAARRTPAAQAGGQRYGLAEPQDKPAGAVRIASYNLLNLFDHVDDPTLSGEFDDMTLAIAPDRAAALAAAIRALDADILAVQEIESEAALRWFRDQWLGDMGYEHIVSRDVGNVRGIENAVLSRFKIIDARVWPKLPLDSVQRTGPGWTEVPAEHRRGLTFQRSPLMVEVQVDDDYRLTLFVLHHKSGGNFRFQREAEAVRAIELISEAERREPGRNIVVLGDFNAAPWDKSLRLYLQAGLIDTLAYRIIPRWRDFDPAEPNLYKTHESDRVLDYVLLNSAAARELVIGSAHVYGTLTPPESYDWRRDPHPAGYASDHYPVVIDLMPKDEL